DITSYPLGVISEIGGSLGLNKRIFFFWDKKEPFDAKTLPKLINRTDVMEIDFFNRDVINALLQKRMFSPSELKKSLNICPIQSRKDKSKCEFHSVNNTKKHSKWVFIYTNDSLEKLKSKLVGKSKNFQLTPKSYKDFSGERLVCKICRAISSCQYSIIDISDTDLDGVIISGMIRIRDYKAILISKTGTVKEISMWDKVSMNWNDETIDDDINELFKTLVNL
ncbi:MAG: hypothetical protein ACE5H1_10965, partial [Thermodesulfobacteriota bacterium]